MNYLVLIDEIDLPPRLFTTVVLPAGVLAELQHPRTPPRVASWARELPPWVRMMSPKGQVEDVGQVIDAGDRGFGALEADPDQVLPTFSWVKP